jgi:plasmid stabilization system protein ParE
VSFRIELTRRAAQEIEEQYHWLAERSQSAADRWRDSLLAAVNSLAKDPERCPEAPEAEWYGERLRQYLHRKRRRTHRILFDIRGDVVIILRVRHSAQDLIRPDELE